MRQGALSSCPIRLRLDSLPVTLPAACALLLHSRITWALETASASLEELLRERQQQGQGGLSPLGSVRLAF